MNPNEDNMNNNMGNSNPNMQSEQNSSSQEMSNQEKPAQTQNTMEVNYKDEKMEASVKMPVQEKHTGGAIGAIIIVIILAVGGLYYWGKQINERQVTVNDAMTAEEIANNPDARTEILGAQGSSDEVLDIEADLDATNLEGLDAELDAINQELTI